MFKNLFVGLVAFSLVAGTVVEADASDKPKKVKYAKSEVDKAVGKCAGTVLGGALLGALIAGKEDRAKGAVAGAVVGGGICALIVSDAKKKDRLFQAQLNAARSERGTYSETFVEADGSRSVVSASANETQMVAVDRLVPVRHTNSGGARIESPVLPGPEALCRSSTARVQVASGESADAPTQLTCRADDGDYWAYAFKRGRELA